MNIGLIIFIIWIICGLAAWILITYDDYRNYSPILLGTLICSFLICLLLGAMALVFITNMLYQQELNKFISYIFRKLKKIIINIYNIELIKAKKYEIK